VTVVTTDIKTLRAVAEYLPVDRPANGIAHWKPRKPASRTIPDNMVSFL